MVLLFTLLQAGLFGLLLSGCAYLLRGAAWATSRPPVWPPGPPPALPHDRSTLPLITVALPIRNERYVAKRVIEAACALDWPRLQIQVLDDSDDDTSGLIDQVVEGLQHGGHDVQVVRRQDRAGYKAGNLQHGLRTARGAFIAVLDADCVPEPDFLQRLVPPLLQDPALAFAQGRWAFDNEDHSLLTRAQALLLHGLFTIEQDRLSAAGLPLSFNGSGGVFRRTALDAAGGWLGTAAHASIAEDLDLSYRARLLGLRGLHLPQVAVSTELPQSMAAFRAQQARWVRGSGQVLRTTAGKILSGVLPRREVLTMLGHLLRHARQPYLALGLLWLPLTATGALRPALALPWAALLLLCHGAIAAYYGAALRRLGRSPLQAVLLALVLLWLSLGLCLRLSAALLRGLGGGPAAFVRTPKSGGQQGAYRAPSDWLALVEAGLGGSYLVLGALVSGSHPLEAAFLWAYAAPALLWVGLSTLLG